MAKPRSHDGARTYSKGSCLKWRPFEVALAAAAGARYPLQEIGGPIVEQRANCSCSGCSDMALFTIIIRLREGFVSMAK